jgi:hypothetical protein
MIKGGVVEKISNYFTGLFFYRICRLGEPFDFAQNIFLDTPCLAEGPPEI